MQTLEENLLTSIVHVNKYWTYRPGYLKMYRKVLINHISGNIFTDSESF